MAYRQGSPPSAHLLAGAALTGAARGGVFEIGLAERQSVDDVCARLTQMLPEADVLAVVESPGGALADVLTASRWRIDLELPLATVAAAVEAFWPSSTSRCSG
ncbi:MAG: hypothetical protein R2731_12915 [Nocardioides sp.]